MVAWRFVVSAQLGLHALAATLFVQTAAAFAAEIEVEKAGERVNGKSVLDMLTLVAGQGSAIIVRARGADAAEAVQALRTLVEGILGAHRPERAHQGCQL
jgi:phosphocarrier protein HPr